MALAQQQQQQQRIPSTSSITLINGSSTIFTPSRRRLISTTTVPISTSLTNDQSDRLTTEPVIGPSNSPHRSTVQSVLIIIVCSLMIFVTVVGNLVVILAVCLVRKLRTASNILIVSLAVSDIFVGLFIMPIALGKTFAIVFLLCLKRFFYFFFLVYELHHNAPDLGKVMCDIWTSTDVLLCTASILNFLVISIDRYCIINHPFKYAPMRKAKLLSIMIGGVWVLSALVSLAPVLGWGSMYQSYFFFV